MNNITVNSSSGQKALQKPLTDSNNYLNKLPNVLIVNKILYSLSFEDIISFGKTCTRFKQLSDRDCLWQECFSQILNGTNKATIHHFLNDGSRKYLDQFKILLISSKQDLITKKLFTLLEHRCHELTVITRRLIELEGPIGLVAIARQKYNEAKKLVNHEEVQANSLVNNELMTVAEKLEDLHTFETCLEYKEYKGTKVYFKILNKLSDEKDSLNERIQVPMKYTDTIYECLDLLKCSPAELNQKKLNSEK